MPLPRKTVPLLSELDGKPWIRAQEPSPVPARVYSLAELYHQGSKYHRALMVREPLDAGAALALPRRTNPRGTPLPPPSPDLALSLGQALRRRRSIRHFKPERLSLQGLADLAFHAAGVTAEVQFEQGGKSWPRALRTYPSGGALYPVELFILPQHVEGMEGGAFCYSPPTHSLVPVVTAPAVATAVGQAMAAPTSVVSLEHAQAVLVLVGAFAVAEAKYGRRGYRFVVQESGHLAQNVLLSAAALGLGAVPLGAFYDDEVNRLLGLNGVRESALYVIPVGVPVELPRGPEDG